MTELSGLLNVTGLGINMSECKQCAKLRADIAAMAVERTEMSRLIGALIVQNNQLKEQAEARKPRKIAIGDRVKANDTAGFHKGAEGVVQFVEPSYEKVWVLRDGSSGPVFYHPSELDVLVKVEDVEVAKE